MQDVYLPEIPQKLIDDQWNDICPLVEKAIDKYQFDFKHSYVIIPYKIFDVNRKKLEEKGFWTTNHTQSHVVETLYVTAVSWA